MSSCVDGLSLQLSARVKFALTLRLLEGKVNTTSSLAVMTNVDISAMDASLDLAAVVHLSNLVRTQRLSLPFLVRQLRGESATDPRPNKALDPVRLERLLQGNPCVNDVVKVARFGIVPSWKHRESELRATLKNHKSTADHEVALFRSTAAGQADGKFLVVALDVRNISGLTSFVVPSELSRSLGLIPVTIFDPSMIFRISVVHPLMTILIRLACLKYHTQV